jgi:hypothetical protein
MPWECMSSKRTMSVYMACIMVVSIFSGMDMMDGEGINGSFGGGDGTSGNPYIIEDARDLQNMSSNLSAYYVLSNDIDASATVGWNSGAGFAPVGTSANKFTGGLDGKNYTISGLFIKRSSTDNVGLFGYISPGGSVKNIGLVDSNVTGRSNVGGLVGWNYGTVSFSYATGNVTGTGDCIGGLVGANYQGTLNGSHASGNVNGTGIGVGGLAGYNSQGMVNNSYSTANVTGKNDIAGGLVGENDHGTVINSFATGNVNGTVNTGGLLGYNFYGPVNSSFSTGNVTGTKYVGGLVGADFQGTVNDSYATGFVTGTNANTGGLLGTTYRGSVNDSHARGNVTGTTSSVGGLIGENYNGKVNNSYAAGNVFGKCDNVGGLVGYNRQGIINNSNATGNITGTNNRVGGLVGNNSGMVNTSYATGNVTGTDYVGGLVGLSDSGTVKNSYATGNVMGNGTVGGLAGCNNGTVNNSYAAGKVFGNTSVGGFLGQNPSGTVANCFWDNETSGQNSSDSGTGKTTAEMKTRSTFTDAGWNFTSIWCMIENITYPFFRWQDTEPPTANAGPDQIVDEGTTVAFNGSGSSDNYGIANYAWKFTDGTPVTLYGVQPTYRFDNPGSFFVNLNVTDAADYWDTDILTITVNDITPPVADAGLDLIIEKGNLVTFNGSGSSDNAGIVNYAWTFADGTPIALSGVQPKYQFNVYGLFIVTLNVTDAAGNWDTDTMTVTVKDITLPSADAGPDQIVDEDIVVTFNGSGSSDNIGIVDCSWTFIDGAPITLYGVQPTYRFDNPGIFAVTLNITDAAGNWDNDTMNVTVKDITAPVADAGHDQIVDEGTLVKFNASGSSDNVGAVNYTWTFIDGTPITLYGIQPTYRFDNPGLFVITLNVTDAAGNWDAGTMTVTVIDITVPVADAGQDQTVNEGTIVTFNGSGSSGNVGIVNYTWSFTDGASIVLFGIQQTYKFSNPGFFVVTLNVTDASGNWDTDILTVTVNDLTAPVADAGPDQTIDEGIVVTFDGSGSSDNVGIVNYTWTFVDLAPVMLHGVKPICKFNAPGTFILTLNVSDAAGNWGHDTLTIIVKDITPPVADAGQDRTVPVESTVLLNGSLSTDNDDIGRYSWNFTYDGETMSFEGKEVSFTFNRGGIYGIVLTVNDLSGNLGNDSVVITVVETGRVTGTVLDGNKKPVGGASVEVIASHGIDRTQKTAADGTFSIDIYHGPFTWTISKAGYRKISGSSSVNPMDEVQLDLSDHPLLKEDKEGPSGSLMMPVLLIIIATAAVGAGSYVFMRRKRIRPG